MDATTQECVIDEQIEEAYQCLLPYKDRIIGLGEGNHERVIANMGTNPIQRLSDKLGCEYLGYTFMCQLRLRTKSGIGRTVTIYGNHGWGGGSRTQGGDLTKFARPTGYYDADLFLFGHVHRSQHDEIARLGIVQNKLIAKPKHVCICGTFLKTISPDAIPSWAETRGFQPAKIGGINITIKPSMHNWCNIKVQI